MLNVELTSYLIRIKGKITGCQGSYSNPLHSAKNNITRGRIDREQVKRGALMLRQLNDLVLSTALCKYEVHVIGEEYGDDP